MDSLRKRELHGLHFNCSKFSYNRSLPAGTKHVLVSGGNALSLANPILLIFCSCFQKKMISDYSVFYYHICINVFDR